MKGRHYWISNPLYIKRPHYCPQCKSQMVPTRIKRIADSPSDLSIDCDYGDVISETVFICSDCKKQLSVNEMLKAEGHRTGPHKILFSLLVVVFFVFISIFTIKHDPYFSLDDFSTDTVSDELVVNTRSRCSYKRKGSFSSGFGTGVRGDYSRYDDDQIKHTITEFTGILTVSASKVKNECLVLNISTTLSSGEAVIYIICDDTVVEIIEPNQDYKFTRRVTDEEIVIVKLVGENADLEVSVQRTINEQ